MAPSARVEVLHLIICRSGKIPQPRPHLDTEEGFMGGGPPLSLSFHMKGMRPHVYTLAEERGLLLDENLPSPQHCPCGKTLTIWCIEVWALNKYCEGRDWERGGEGVSRGKDEEKREGDMAGTEYK